MPGPGNQKKRNNKTNNKANDEPGARQPQSVTQTLCQALEEDEMTRCDQPATEGHPQAERCKKHQTQYRLMYKKYKDAGKIVDGLKNDIPDEEQIKQYEDVSSSLKKVRMIRKYVEAIRVERTGRQIHQSRFFLKVDDGHKMRVKVLEKEIDKGIKALNTLYSRAYNLSAEENSLPDWANHPSSEPVDEPDTSELTLGAESFKDSSNFVPAGTAAGVRQSQAHNTEDNADEDVIDLNEEKLYNPHSIHPSSLFTSKHPHKMPPTASNRNKSSSNTDKDPESANSNSTTRPNTRKNGSSFILEDLQDVNDSLEGRKYLEKHSLFCPPGEPVTYQSLATCLHQISALAGLQKPAINAIQSVAFLLDELEDSKINKSVKKALNSQMNKFASDMRRLIEDAKEQIDNHLKPKNQLCPPPIL